MASKILLKNINYALKQTKISCRCIHHLLKKVKTLKSYIPLSFFSFLVFCFR